MNIRDAGTTTAFEIKTLLMQELFQRGVLTIGTHNVSFAHSDADISVLLDAYDAAFAVIAAALKNGDVRAKLRCEPLQPLFKVR